MKYLKHASLLLPVLMASCQVSTPTKEIPVVGQIATGLNTISNNSDLNETSSLFAPRNYKNQKYRVRVPISKDNVETEEFEYKELLYREAVTAVQGDTTREGELTMECASRIDSNYHEWLGDYIRGRASLNTGLDIFAQGLSAAGAMFTPASTVRILSGSSAFVQGANATIESKFFLSLTALQQVPTMTKARKTVRDELSESDSSFQKNLGLLDEYYIAGTLFTAFGTEKEKK
jgi:hypothetical protein